MAASRGRPKGFVMDDSHRVKIQNSNILNALIEHVEGRREMSATQVSAGTALLKKVLPDLSQVDLRGAGADGEHLVQVSADEAFARIASRLASAAARAEGGADGAE
jgi:hypothetical protein